MQIRSDKIEGRRQAWLLGTLNASLCDCLFEGCVLHEHVAKEGRSSYGGYKKRKAGEVPGLLAVCL